MFSGDSVATTSSNLLPGQGSFKLHHLAIYLRKSDGCVFTSHKILFFAHVCSQNVEQDQVPQSIYNMGLCAPQTLSAQTGLLKQLSMYFIVCQNQISSKKIFAAEKSWNNLCLHAFLWAGLTVCQLSPRPVLFFLIPCSHYQKGINKLKCPDKSNAN